MMFLFGEVCEDIKMIVICDGKYIDVDVFWGFCFDEVWVFVCIIFVGEVSFDMGFYNKWF